MVGFATVPLKYKEVWTNTFKIYAKTFTQTWYLALALGFSVSISSLVAYLPQVNTLHFSIVFAIAVVATFFLGVFLMNLIMHRIAAIGNEQLVSLSSSIKIVFAHYYRLILALLATALLTLAGMLAFILPGIIVGLLVLFVQPFILLDNLKVYEALKSSCVLVWENCWRTFLVMAPMIVINLGLGYLISLTAVHHFWLSFATNLIIFAVYSSFSYALLLVQFYDFKLKQALNSKGK